MTTPSSSSGELVQLLGGKAGTLAARYTVQYDEGVVCSELQTGYTCKGSLVRAAYVMVSSG